MRSFIRGILVLPALFAMAEMRAEENLSEVEAEAIAVDAYIYGYPLVTMEMTRRALTNVAHPVGPRAPMGQFANARAYPDASFRAVTAPNADTLYSTAWLDLSQEPYILFLPDERDRYYLMPMLSGWTNVFAAPGTRTEGTGAAMYAITGPAWSGVLPQGIKEIKSPTNMVWIIGRTYCDGTPEDYIRVHALQDQYRLVPLSAFGKAYTPPKAIYDPAIDMTTPVRSQVRRLDAITFFSQLAALMKDNPPAPEDAPQIAQMAKIGIIPGKKFEADKLPPKIVSALMRAPRLASAKIMLLQKNAGETIHGWQFLSDLGKYGTNYPLRAVTTVIGLGANLPEDAVYPMAKVDADGNLLHGAHTYVMHFPAGALPPVRGFWSLTMYNDHYFFAANPLNRYTLSPRNALKLNVDGSLDLYIGSQSPGPEKESNWLPAPTDEFVLILRLYWPNESILNGTWTPPAVEKIAGK